MNQTMPGHQPAALALQRRRLEGWFGQYPGRGRDGEPHVSHPNSARLPCRWCTATARPLVQVVDILGDDGDVGVVLPSRRHG